MSENPRFEKPETPEEEHELVLERSKYLLKHIKEQEQEKSALQEQATIDHLTGLNNLAAFEHNLEQSLETIRMKNGGERRKGAVEELSLIYIDIDHFKKVNDTVGHPGGDAVLREVSRIIKSSVRSGDIGARIGGEELAILMPGATVQVATKHAEGLRTKIENLTFDAYPGLTVTASFGVVSSDESTNAAELRTKADEALYKAKEEGRNKVVTYGPIPTEGE